MDKLGIIPDTEKFAEPDDIGSSDNDEASDNDGQHKKLIQAVQALDKINTSIDTDRRTEPTLQVSDFHVGSSSEKVRLHQLVGALHKSNQHGELKKQLIRVQKKQKVLATPLPRVEQEKIERTLAYDQTSKEVSKWVPVVVKNREAEQLQFPLERPDIRLHTTTQQLVQKFQPRTPLEMEVAALLRGNKAIHQDDRMLTPAEERALKAMSLEEAKERRAELQKHRALLSYQETKARRRNKIKSKRYHRILKKETRKKEEKALEDMEKNDPDGYAEQVTVADKQRIQERMSLKHRGSSKFMKKQMIYGKYDEEIRQSVQEMNQKSRELTEKQAIDDSDASDEEEQVEDGDDDDEVPSSKPSALHTSANPWMKSALSTQASTAKYKKPEAFVNENIDECEEPDSEAEEAVAHNVKAMPAESEEMSDVEEEVQVQVQHKPVKKSNKQKTSQTKTKPTQKLVAESLEDEDDPGSSLAEGLVRKKTLEDFAENAGFENDAVKEDSGDEVVPVVNEATPDSTIQVDPSNFMTVETVVRNSQAPVVADDDEAEDTETDQRMTIAEAFVSDDVIEEFNVEKKDIEERDKPKDIDLTLPGWGNWGGKGVQVSKKKRKRFLIKAPPAAPRKDALLDNVIISETKDKAVSKYQVNQLPFPYTNVSTFESTIRQPIGKTWNPETAFKKLVKPKVVSRMGTVIDPIDKATTFKDKKKRPFEESGKFSDHKQKNDKKKFKKSRS